MFAGRFFIGWAVGGLSAAVPMYNSEVAPAELRGTVVATQQCAIVTGKWPLKPLRARVTSAQSILSVLQEADHLLCLLIRSGILISFWT